MAGDRIEAGTMIMAAAITGDSIALGGITAAEIPQGLVCALAGAGVRLHPEPVAPAGQGRRAARGGTVPAIDGCLVGVTCR